MRLDAWLFVARFYKSKALAKEMIGKGEIRVNKVKTTNKAREIALGDTLTFMKGDKVYIVEICAFAEMRRPFEEAKQLYKIVANE